MRCCHTWQKLSWKRCGKGSSGDRRGYGAVFRTERDIFIIPGKAGRMGEIKLLDCTLRDGGYINDWKFGHEHLSGIFGRLAAAGIDVIEAGFIDERRDFDRNRSIMPDAGCMQTIYGGTDRGHAMVVGMIDYGTCRLERIPPCRQSFLDGIRVIFKKPYRKQALRFCDGLKQLGYKVFVQLVSITDYEDAELLDVAGLANNIEPYAVSMVDTYGLLHQERLLHVFRLLHQHLLPGIAIGFHGHNNFQMAYANCIAVLSQNVCRTLLVDGSICGMGKGAGNVPTELLVMYLNRVYAKGYRISELLEAADAHILQFGQSAAWGYSLPSFLAAYHQCHPDYVFMLMEERRLSIRDVNEVLGLLEQKHKLAFNKETMEQLLHVWCLKDSDKVSGSTGVRENENKSC